MNNERKVMGKTIRRKDKRLKRKLKQQNRSRKNRYEDLYSEEKRRKDE